MHPFTTFQLEAWKKNRYNSLCRRINVKIDDALPTFYFSFEFHRAGHEKYAHPLIARFNNLTYSRECNFFFFFVRVLQQRFCHRAAAFLPQFPFRRSFVKGSPLSPTISTPLLEVPGGETATLGFNFSSFGRAMIAAVFLLPPPLPVFPEPRNYSVKVAACIICQDEDPSWQDPFEKMAAITSRMCRRGREGEWFLSSVIGSHWSEIELACVNLLTSGLLRSGRS